MLASRLFPKSAVRAARNFSTTIPALSHIGAEPVFVGSDVKIETNDLLFPTIIPKGRNSMKLDRMLTIKGPKGAVDVTLADFVHLNEKDGHMFVTVDEPTARSQRSMWGTTRSLINNAVVGVTEGHSSMLRFKGTGYRVMLEKDEDGVEWVKMKVGRCNLEGLPIPQGITCTVPSPTLLILEGADKQQLNLFAGKLRNMRPPEPYKGKGIYMNGETIKLKVRKVN